MKETGSGISRRVLVYRPYVCPSGSAFEAQALIYNHLQEKHGWRFRLLIADKDSFSSDELDVVRHSFSRMGMRMQALLPTRSSLLLKEMDRFSPDLVLGLDPSLYGQGIQLIRSAQSRGLPAFVDVSSTVLGRTRASRFGNLLLRYRARHFDHVRGIFATAPKCIERLSLIRKPDAELCRKICILGHPFDDREPRGRSDPSKADKTIVVVSRLVVEKGIHFILEALRPVLEQHREWRLKFIGSGPLKERISAWSREHALESRIECTGFVSHAEVRHHLACSDIYVSHALDTPVWEEFFGIANIEAMAHGLPCVVSDSGSIPWVIRDKDAAEIIPQRDVRKLGEAVRRLVEDPDLRRRMGVRGQAYANAHYSLGILAEKYRHFVESMLS